MEAITYEVIPHRGVGPVRLSMSRAQCRAAMGEPPHVFRKTLDSAVTTDAWHRNSFQVFYDPAERVEYVELAKGPEVEPVLDGVPVLRVPADEAVGHIVRVAAFDESDPELPYSYVFQALDLALWRPTLPEDEHDREGRTFSTVGVGVRGYFARS
jgi:hypothetical protein